jgi:hypothetical protein
MSSGPNLDRFLHAIADPTRRRILLALKEKGGASIEKETGLCAGDIEHRRKAGAAYRFASYADFGKSRPGGGRESGPLALVPAQRKADCRNDARPEGTTLEISCQLSVVSFQRMRTLILIARN